MPSLAVVSRRVALPPDPPMKPLFPALLLLLSAAAAPAAERLTFEQACPAGAQGVLLFTCHGAEEKPKGKLDPGCAACSSPADARGRASSSAKPAESLLLDRMRSGARCRRVEKKVPKEQIALIERWIAAAPLSPARRAGQLAPGIDITPEERAYWFFQPVKRHALPSALVSANAGRCVLARDDGSKNLAFNPDADRATLIRRVTLGLDRAAADAGRGRRVHRRWRPDAYERLVDRLLASPAYGERWPRHWLDVAGYADSDGDGTNDTPRPHAWALSRLGRPARSTPTNRSIGFVVEQLATS
ncbi:MAG: DUF1549 domain-containing protein [Gemmataceae bacterium]